MENTTENFWRMCLQERVGLIVTLVHSIGGSQGDCAEYFPRKVPIETTHDYGDISVTLLKEEKVDFTTRRELKVKNRISNKEASISHWHFAGWPDWELPIG